MATVIRSPQLNKKPRKLQASEVAAVPASPQPASETRESPEYYAAPEIRPAEKAAPTLEQAPAAAPPITEEEFADLQHRLERAESRAELAERELAGIRSDLENLKVDARNAGLESGREEAAEKLEADYRQRLRSVDQVLDSLSAQIEGMVAQAEDSIVETVYAAVAKIIGDQLTEPDSIVAIVRHVSNQLVRPEKFTVRLAPADYELITSGRERFFEGGDEVASPVRILPDSRIELGGCILESAAGSLDARLEVQLQRLKDVLLDSRARRQIELQSKQ